MVLPNKMQRWLLTIALALFVLLLVASCSSTVGNTEEDYDEILQGTWDYFRPAYEDPKIGHVYSFGERLSFDEGTLIYVAYSEEDDTGDHKVVGTYDVAGDIITTNLNDHEEQFTITKEGDDYIISKQYEEEDELRVYHKLSDTIQDHAYGNEGKEADERGSENAIESDSSTSEKTLDDAINDYVQYGNYFMDTLQNVNTLSNGEKFKRYQEADNYAAKLKDACTKIINVGEGRKGFDDIQYHFKLVRNMIPEPIEGSSNSEISNQTILYSYLLQQISSTSSYLSDYLNYLKGEGEKPIETTFFSEVPEMVTPDTAIYGITYDSYAEVSGVKQYTYILADNANDAKLNYNIYLYALEMDSGLKAEINDESVLVYRDGVMVSAMMAGTDSDKGMFLTVSFK